MHGRRTDPEKLRKLIAKRQLTLKAFRETAEIGRTQWQYVLAGKRDFSDPAAERVAEALGVEVDDFTVPQRRPPRRQRKNDEPAA